MAGLIQRVEFNREQAKWLARELKVDFHFMSEKRADRLEKEDPLKFEVFRKLFFT
jgi:hypothetical protein